LVSSVLFPVVSASTNNASESSVKLTIIGVLPSAPLVLKVKVWLSTRTPDFSSKISKDGCFFSPPSLGLGILKILPIFSLILPYFFTYNFKSLGKSSMLSELVPLILRTVISTL
jgi:hypothetical protein